MIHLGKCQIEINVDTISFCFSSNEWDPILTNRSQFKNYEYCNEYARNNDCLLFEEYFAREDEIDVDCAILQISKMLRKMIARCGILLPYADKEYGPQMYHTFSFNDKSKCCEMYLSLTKLTVNEAKRIYINEIKMLHENTGRCIAKMKMMLLNYKLDLKKYIVIFGNKINITYDISMDVGGLYPTFISGYLFQFSFDIYTCEKFYEDGSKGFYELKLANLNPNNGNYNHIELIACANELSITTDNLNEIYTQLQKWVSQLTLRVILG